MDTQLKESCYSMLIFTPEFKHTGWWYMLKLSKDDLPEIRKTHEYWWRAERSVGNVIMSEWIKANGLYHFAMLTNNVDFFSQKNTHPIDSTQNRVISNSIFNLWYI